MTEWGITSENTAKWHEIHVTPQQADTVGLMVLATGLAVFVIGRLVCNAPAGKKA